MAVDRTKLASALLDGVGGTENVAGVVHCATRLRFKLKDSSKADAGAIQQIEGVITALEKGGQFQVVIGNTVPEVYKELIRVGGISTEEAAAAPQGGGGNILSRLIDTIAGIFPPLMGVMFGAGLIKGVLALLSVTNVLNGEMGTYIVLDALSDSVFYFLPVLLGFSAGRKFGANPFVTALLGATMIYPSLTALAGETITFLRIPLVMIDYSSSVIPILVAAWLCAKIEVWGMKVMPASVKNFLTPTLCLLVTVPVTLLAIGPVCTYLSTWLADGCTYLFTVSPILGGLIVAGFWQTLVIFGLHWSFVPIMISNIATVGFDSLLTMTQIAALAQTGAAFGLGLKMRDRAQRAGTLSTVFAGVCGITEPIIYGVTLPRKKFFALASVVAAVSGAVAGAMGSKATGMALGIFVLPTTIDPVTGIGGAFWGTLVGIVMALVLSAVLCFLFFKDDTVQPALATAGGAPAPAPAASAAPTAPAATAGVQAATVYSPMKGEAVALSRSADPVQARETLGKGALLLPAEGKVFAPFDGTVSMLYDSKHALGLTSDDGVELLVHIGLDTVRLEGKYFSPRVRQGQRIKTGDLLMEFDMAGITDAGYALETPVVVINTPDYTAVTPAFDKDIRPGDALIRVE